MGATQSGEPASADFWGTYACCQRQQRLRAPNSVERDAAAVKIPSVEAKSGSRPPLQWRDQWESNQSLSALLPSENGSPTGAPDSPTAQARFSGSGKNLFANKGSGKNLTQGIYSAPEIPQDWAPEQQAALEEAVHAVSDAMKLKPPSIQTMKKLKEFYARKGKFSGEVSIFWSKVALCVHSKTADECFERYAAMQCTGIARFEKPKTPQKAASVSK